MAVLHVGKDVPLVVDVVGSLQEHVAVQLVGGRVVITVFTVSQQRFAQFCMLHVGQVAEVVTIVVLYRQTTDDIPSVILVVDVPHESIGVLFQTLFANEIGLLDLVTLAVFEGQSILGQLVVLAELLVVAVAVGVVQRSRCAPLVVDMP